MEHRKIDRSRLIKSDRYAPIRGRPRLSCGSLGIFFSKSFVASICRWQVIFFLRCGAGPRLPIPQINFDVKVYQVSKKSLKTRKLGPGQLSQPEHVTKTDPFDFPRL